MRRSFVFRVLHLFHRYVCIFVRLVMVAFYGKHGESIPPIDDRLLLESATSIAEKIRKREVRIIKWNRSFYEILGCQNRRRTKKYFSKSKQKSHTFDDLEIEADFETETVNFYEFDAMRRDQSQRWTVLHVHNVN